jgi:hypothetical protein
MNNRVGGFDSHTLPPFLTDRSMKRRWLTGSALLLVVAGCAVDDAGRSRTESRDSAGITIVQNSQPKAAAPLLWTTAPLVTISPEDSARTQGLFGHVVDVTADTSGRIYVLDQQAQQVRVFSPEGQFVHALGRPGRGPGELTRFANAVLITTDGSVYVPDYALSRVNVFSRDGAVMNPIALNTRPGGRSWRLTDQGDLVYRGISISRDSTGEFKIWDGVVRARPGAPALDTLLVFDYEKTPVGQDPGGMMRVPLLVNAALWSQLPDGRIVWSSLDRESINIAGPDGRLQRIIRYDAWRRPALTDADRAALVNLLREKLGFLGGDVSAADGPGVTVWDRLPAISDIRNGPDNTIWIQRAAPPAEFDAMSINSPDAPSGFGGSHWDVANTDGEILGSVSFPRGFRPFTMRDSTVYGVQVDSLNVQRISVLRLRRPAQGS